MGAKSTTTSNHPSTPNASCVVGASNTILRNGINKTKKNNYKMQQKELMSCKSSIDLVLRDGEQKVSVRGQGRITYSCLPAISSIRKANQD